MSTATVSMPSQSFAKEARTRNYSLDVQHKRGDANKRHQAPHSRSHWKDVQARRTNRWHSAVDLDGAWDPQDEEDADLQREMLRVYEERHRARLAEESAAAQKAALAVEAAPLDFIPTTSKPTRQRVEARVDAEDDDYEIVAKPSTAGVTVLEEEALEGPEPHEEWECLDVEDDKPKEVKPSYALVAGIR